ncbi:MAG TPA: alpha/beta hydrolase-fold protein [Candidatus Dormibacteraeota bacterium]|nr:alpha/beta hydrolase-fold protein [Candidatus Dormibacteraeota bacterium]
MHQTSPYARLQGLSGDLHVDFIESAALRGNALGDPAVRPSIVYVPPGYDPQGSQRYPVLYCLHGYTGDAAALLATRPWETNVVQWADRLIVKGEMRPAIVALVDGFTRLGGSQYVDSAHNGAYATYVVRDVVGHIDASYRTIAREGGRAVFGKSSGGFGAMHLSIAHPGIFAAFASHSGDAYFEYAHPRGFADAQRTLERFDFDLKHFVEDFEARHKRSQAEYGTMEMLGYAAAYSPRSGAAFDIDLPFDRATGAIRQDVFARWLAFDPVRRIGSSVAELQRLRLRYLDCGRRDEYGLDIGARLVATGLRNAGLSVVHEEFDDDHRNVGYRYARSLPLLAAALDIE